MARRRVRLAFVISLAAAIGAAASVAIYRAPIVEFLITTAMRAKGIPAPRMTVSDVGWSGIGLADMSLGQAGEVTVRGMRLDYSLAGLLASRLDRVAIDGLVIALNLTGNAPLLGSLQPFLSGGDSGGEPLGPIPPLSLTDLRINAQTSAGIVRAIGDGQVRTADNGETTIEMSLQEISLGGKALASGRFSANVSTARTTGIADFFVTDVSLPERLAGLNARVRLAFDATEDVITFRLLEDATLAATQLSPVFLQSLGIQSEIADQITQGFAARLQASAPIAIVSRTDGTMALDGTLRLTVPNFVDLNLTLPVDIRLEDARVRGLLRTPAELRLSELRYSGVAELLEPTAVTITEAEVTGDLDYRVTMSGPTFRLQSQGVEATITPGQITLTPGRVKIAEAQIAIPALSASSVSATVDTTDAETRIAFQIANVRQTDLVPFTVTGAATLKGDVWRGTAKGAGPNGIGRIVARGSYDGATTRGQAHIALEPLAFTPGGAQPGTLSPALSTLKAVSGTTAGEADLSWSPQGVQGTGTLVLKDIGFDSPQARVEGLNLDLNFNSLSPPGSPPRQILTIRRLEAGVPLDRLDIRFQIQPTAPPSLTIETAEVFLGTGRFALNDLAIDPTTSQQDVDLRVQDLSLAELFAILNIDGLDGDGRLSGTIPVIFSDGTVVIENGRLAANGPGTIRFRSEKAAQILADQGESLDLVLRALEDFRYEELTIDLEKSADDVGRVKLSLLGKNPTVLEGYPFRFNISIEADTAKLVTALSAVYQVPNDFLRRAWTSGR